MTALHFISSQYQHASRAYCKELPELQLVTVGVLSVSTLVVTVNLPLQVEPPCPGRLLVG